MRGTTIEEKATTTQEAKTAEKEVTGDKSQRSHNILTPRDLCTAQEVFDVYINSQHYLHPSFVHSLVGSDERTMVLANISIHPTKLSVGSIRNFVDEQLNFENAFRFQLALNLNYIKIGLHERLIHKSINPPISSTS